MNNAEFDKLAGEFDADVYGDTFSESGYGICFVFDLCYALSAYCQGHWQGEGDPLYACYRALGRPPIWFREGAGGGFDPDAEFDPENDEYSTARELYKAMEEKPEFWRDCFAAVLWYSEECEKRGEL